MPKSDKLEKQIGSLNAYHDWAEQNETGDDQVLIPKTKFIIRYKILKKQQQQNDKNLKLSNNIQMKDCHILQNFQPKNQQNNHQLQDKNEIEIEDNPKIHFPNQKKFNSEKIFKIRSSFKTNINFLTIKKQNSFEQKYQKNKNVQKRSKKSLKLFNVRQNKVPLIQSIAHKQTPEKTASKIWNNRKEVQAYLRSIIRSDFNFLLENPDIDMEMYVDKIKRQQKQRRQQSILTWLHFNCRIIQP